MADLSPERIADVLARTYDGQPLADLRDEHAAHHLEAADAILALADGVEVSSYQVALLPPGHPMRDFAAVTVRLCESGRWQVDRLGFLLDAEGRWEQRAKRPREWRAAREYDLPTAIRLAQAAAPAVRVGDSTVRELLERQP